MQPSEREEEIHGIKTEILQALDSTVSKDYTLVQVVELRKRQVEALHRAANTLHFQTRAIRALVER